jgi:hypothetical protein
MKIPEYIEMSFAMPFYEFYYPDTWNNNNLAKNPYELIELTQKLNINLDPDFLFTTYVSLPATPSLPFHQLFIILR